MVKLIGFVAIGCTVGVAAFLAIVLWFPESDPGATPPDSPTVATTPKPAREQPPTRSSSRSLSLAELWRGGSEFERTAALYGALLDADSGDVERLLQEADGLRLQRQRRAAKSIIYSRYAELDPLAAVAHVESRGADARFLGTVFAAWAKIDIDAAIERADALEYPARRHAGIAILSVSEDLGASRRHEIAHRFSADHVLTQARQASQAEFDPEGAWLDAVAMTPGEARTQAAWRALQSWIGVDPATALQAVVNFPEPRVRDQWRKDLVRRWAKADVQAALDWALALPASGQRSGLIAQAAKELAQVSPLEALEIAADLEPHMRRQINTAAFQAWGRDDPSGALAALEVHGDEQSINSMRRGLVAAWAGVDPQAAFDWVVSNPRSPDYSWLVETPLQILAQASPQRAMALADELDDDTRRNIMGGLLRVWSEDDPQAAAAWIDGASLYERDAVTAVVRNYAMLDAEAAFDWVAGLPLSARRNSLPHLMRAVTDDSLTIARRLVDRIDDSTLRHNAARPMVARWVQTDPDAALRWIADEEHSNARSRLYADAFENWFRHNREGAVAAVRKLPDAAKEGATMAMINQALYAQDAAVVARLFEGLEGDRSRRNAARFIARRLRNTDPDLAEVYDELARQ